MDISQFPEPRLECKQVLRCPKCKTGTFQRSSDVNIFLYATSAGTPSGMGSRPRKQKKVSPTNYRECPDTPDNPEPSSRPTTRNPLNGSGK